MEIRDPTYRPLGAACIALGLAAFYIASDYAYGTVTAMGPGFIPTAVAICLTALGAIILLAGGRDLQGASDKADETLVAQASPFFSPGFIRATVSIIGAITLFGLAIKSLGLAITVFLTVVVGGLGHPGARLRPLLTLAIGLSIGSCLVFVVLLSQQIPIYPRLR